MSEIPKGTQFVGQADASKLHQEAPVKSEFTISPEQQQVADALKEGGNKLADSVIEARARAAGKLQSLRGKELVDAGLRQMGRGAWETFRSELKWGIPMYILGTVGGAAAGYASVHGLSTESGRQDIADRLSEFADQPVNPPSAESARATQQFVTGLGATIGAGAGRDVGVFLGYETAGIKYNKKIAVKENLPSTKFVDWVVGNAANVGLQTLLKGRFGFVGQLVVNEVTNPITVGGLRNVATGLWQMRKG